MGFPPASACLRMATIWDSLNRLLRIEFAPFPGRILPLQVVQFPGGRSTRHALGAALYAPLRVLISEDDAGRTCPDYDLPSSLFGRLGDERITRVARTLDKKLSDLIALATGVEVGGGARPPA